jgi:triacylglycerol lipase
MSETFTIEIGATDFEKQRAIDAYIPLLECSYQLARELPFDLPSGYEEMSQVRANPGEVSRIALDEATPDAQPEAAALAAATVNADLFGFVVRETASSSVIVSIRGTLVAEEWLRNFTAIPVDYSFLPDYGVVHLGFRKIYETIRESLRQGLHDVAANTRITVIGHSLGGAVAILAAPDIKRTFGKQRVDVCTFGGPRVGKPDFMRSFNEDIPGCFRLTNQFDIVPHVPTISTGWMHVGKEIEVDGNLDSAHSLVAYVTGMRAIDQPAAGLTERDTVRAGLVSAVVP